MWILVAVAHAIRARRESLPADLVCVVILCVVACVVSVRCYPRLGGPDATTAIALDRACARLLYVALLLRPSTSSILACMPWVVLLTYALSASGIRPEHDLLPHATFRYFGYWWIVLTLRDSVPSWKEVVVHSFAYWSHVFHCVPGSYGTDCAGVLALGMGAAMLGEALP